MTRQHTFASFGPGVTWKFIGKISAAIPTLRKLKDHFEDEWNVYSRYERHTHPDYEDDIERLAQRYAEAKLHCGVQGRKVNDNAKSADYIQDGAKAIATGKPISRWQTRRKQDMMDNEEWAEDGENAFD